jgi:hypothetical protein
LQDAVTHEDKPAATDGNKHAIIDYDIFRFMIVEMPEGRVGYLCWLFNNATTQDRADVLADTNAKAILYAVDQVRVCASMLASLTPELVRALRASRQSFVQSFCMQAAGWSSATAVGLPIDQMHSIFALAECTGRVDATEGVGFFMREGFGSYAGEFVGKFAEGLGVFTWCSGGTGDGPKNRCVTVAGEWSSGMPVGHMVLRFSDGSIEYWSLADLSSRFVSVRPAQCTPPLGGEYIVLPSNFGMGFEKPVPFELGNKMHAGLVDLATQIAVRLHPCVKV